MTYEVTSVSPSGKPLKESRDTAHEAVGLAKQWMDRQHKEVELTDHKTGQTYRDKTLLDLYREVERKP